MAMRYRPWTLESVVFFAVLWQESLRLEWRTAGRALPLPPRVTQFYYLNAGDFVNGYINAFLIDGVTELMRHGWARRRGVKAGGSRAQAVAASAISALVIVAVELFPSTLNRPDPADVPAGIVGALLYLGVRLFALGRRLQVKPTL